MREFDLSKQTVEQYEGDCGCDPEVGCVPCELCHDLAVIGRLRSENERLRAELMVNAESGDAARKERNEALAEIGRQREENERLREALIEIRDSKYCQYENTESVRRASLPITGQVVCCKRCNTVKGSYGIGVTDGHRFCSAIARKAINVEQQREDNHDGCNG